MSHPAVEKTKEAYAVKVIYQDSDAKAVGNLSDKFYTLAGSMQEPQQFSQTRPSQLRMAAPRSATPQRDVQCDPQVP